MFKLGAHQSKVDLIGNKYCSLPSYSETLHTNDYPNLFLISLYLSTNANDSRSLSRCTASLGREPQSVMMARVIISKCNMNLAEISGQVVMGTLSLERSNPSIWNILCKCFVAKTELFFIKTKISEKEA